VASASLATRLSLSLALGAVCTVAAISVAACGDSPEEASAGPSTVDPLNDAAPRADGASNAGEAGGDGGVVVVESACKDEGAACTSPPPPTCANGTTRRTFTPTGSCTAGKCSYASTDAACAAPANADGVCAAGACAAFACKPGFLPLGPGCVFGTAHNTWTTLQSMTTPRYWHGSTAGADGRLYVVGGETQTAGSPINYFGVSVEAYTPSTNTWTPLADLSTGSQAIAAVSLDGKIYRIGGGSALEAYTPSTNTWATLTSHPGVRFTISAAAGVGMDHRLYALGGTANNLGEKTVFAFTPATNTWAPVADLLTARCLQAAAALPDGRIFVIGGKTAVGGTILASAEVYTPSANTWAPVASLPTARGYLSAATAVDGRIFAFGGLTGGPGTESAVVEAYTPGTNTWAPMASMPAVRAATAAAAGPDGRIYVTGGFAGTSVPTNTVFAYTP